MRADLLKKGDTIGLISPSHIADPERYTGLISHIQGLGFSVKTGANLYRSTYGYSATEKERSDDLNEMVADPDVKLIFFGGGYGSIELLPFIDYRQIKKSPKLFLSYSDGTSILNIITAKTGLITYYGQTPGNFAPPSDYTRFQFFSHLVEGNVREFVPNSIWQTAVPGKCEGTLIGGYLLNFALLLGSPYFVWDRTKRYVLFLEDHERFSSVLQVSALLSHIEQSDFMKNVSGLLFGSYSEPFSELLFERLQRFGHKNGIPVVVCDDFGHGANHAILPVGRRVLLDAAENTMIFTD